MDRNEQGSSGCGRSPQKRHDFAGLAEIQSVEGFVQEQKWMWGQQAQSEQKPLRFSFRERPDSGTEQGPQLQLLGEFPTRAGRPAPQLFEKAKRPLDRLLAP